ncbi:MAG: polysaccharide deacetylase family protein [Candidatus Hydrogenedentes bacterium]|nr:polysaccharide deacetylase family protein [Candidatus Hydrogenedentota bacterium]
MCAEPFRWPEHYTSAVSLSFDDARPSQARFAAPILDAFGLRGTFYVVPKGLNQELEAWKGVLARGHEIGNHTTTHPCTGNFTFTRSNALEDYTLERMEADIQECTRQTQSLLGVTPETFAYPCGNTFVGRGAEVKSYVPIIAQHFLAGRGYPGEYHNDPLFCDLAQLQGRVIDNTAPEVILEWVKQSQKEGGWMVFAAHDVGPKPGPQVVLEESLRALCAYLHAPENGIWVAPVADVARHVVAHRPA